MAPPKPALIAGGIFVLVILVVVVWGYFFSKPKFWGLFAKEGDECTPDEDDEIANADKYQLDKDKKCILVKSCGSGYSPDSSNTACTSSVPSGPSVPSGSSVPSVLPPPPPPEGATDFINAIISDDPAVNGNPENTTKWDRHTDGNNINGAMTSAALQYAKIGGNWQPYLCQYQGVVYDNTNADTKAAKPKACAGKGDNPDDMCLEALFPNSSKAGLTAVGKCGAIECRGGYVPYNGKCTTPSNSPTSKWQVGGNAHFVDELGGQPAYAELPSDELQPDRSCREMCENKGVSSSGKTFKSLLPSNWKGGTVSATQPTSRMFNNSANKLATTPALWDKLTAEVFEEFIQQNENLTDNLSGNAHWLHFFRVNENGNWDTRKSDSDYVFGARDLYNRMTTEVTETDWKNVWKDFLMSKVICACEATEDPRYLYT